MYRQLGLFGVLVMKHSTKQYNTRSHNINWVSVSLSSYWATFTSSWKFFAYCWRTWNDSKRLLKCKLIFLRSHLVKPNICSYDDKEYKQKFFFKLWPVHSMLIFQKNDERKKSLVCIDLHIVTFCVFSV